MYTRLCDEYILVVIITNIHVHCIMLHLRRLISKYHPKHISARDEALKASLQDRVQAFCHLLESGRLDPVPLWTDFVDDIVNAMDAGKYIVFVHVDTTCLCTMLASSPGSFREEGKEPGMHCMCMRSIKILK